MRSHLVKEKADKIVELFLESTIQAVNLSITKEIIVLTKEKERISKKLAKLNSKKVSVLKDTKQTLNASLNFLLRKLFENKNDDNNRTLIIMPDVPALDKAIINRFIDTTNANQLGIYPLEREGTAMILIPKKFLAEITVCFGDGSFNKFKNKAKKLNIEVYSFVSSQRELLSDIDTYQQLQSWLKAKDTANQKEATLKMAIKQLLDKNGNTIVL
jgi:2-phospho-L-lactate guanylyltransferase (CobY/MobA/RfbA family)